MGTGHSADSPIRIAHLGITTVISLVDDILLEQFRKYYCEKLGLPYTEISLKEDDGRAKRTTAYLDLVNDLVASNFDAVKKEPFTPESDKSKYFDLLPDDLPLKDDYKRLLEMEDGPERESLERELTQKMVPGSIDVNIMVKLDRQNVDSKGEPLPDEYSDAKAVLRGYAKSKLRSAIVLSAGMNQRLFNYMTNFSDFYRDESGEAKKKIILKVSDFRSSLIQGKFFAKKGLEIHEYRVESGLNCGGHVFPTNGLLLPGILQEFKENRGRLVSDLKPFILKYYEKVGRIFPKEALNSAPLLTVQGGIGTNGEMRRLMEDFGVDLAGWGTPFLLVPEASCVDDPTLELLKHAGRDDVYIGDTSPLGVQFSNLHGTGAEVWLKKRADEGRPGSPCGKGYLMSSTEFTEKPLCTASRLYEKKKIEQIEGADISDEEKEKLIQDVIIKECICDQLGNGALIALGIEKEEDAPQCMCPGANIEWFNRIYSLKEMVDHIYGRIPSLVPIERPHMFVKEAELYVDHFERQVESCGYTPREIKTFRAFKENLDKNISFSIDISRNEPYPGENLESIALYLKAQGERLDMIFDGFIKKADSTAVEKA